jgi:RNA polymerase sigma-70 factor, ECF subfamily
MHARLGNSQFENTNTKMLTAETTSAYSFGTEHIDSLFRYAIVLTGDRSDAQDLVQEAYVRAMEAFHRLREESNVKAWLITILRNLWFNELRQRRRRPQLIVEDSATHVVEGLMSEGQDAHQILETKENSRRLKNAIERMPPDFREILLLREFEELSYREIAEVLDCPVGTVMSRLGRARAKLKKLLPEMSARPRQVEKGRASMRTCCICYRRNVPLCIDCEVQRRDEDDVSPLREHQSPL